eukprot:GEZU01038833.1.p1 GENE.GEZU01038833.1~~GEZU01038833.1.p1  ORF type:complete len:324 (+),score=114.67 GEZU01038833.1:364-1335(+)
MMRATYFLFTIVSNRASLFIYLLGLALKSSSALSARTLAGYATATEPATASATEAIGINGIKQAILDTFEPFVIEYVSKASSKLVEKLNVVPLHYAFKLNSATPAQLNQLTAENLYNTIARLEDPYIKEWKKNGKDEQKWYASLRSCYGSVETAIYCWNELKQAGIYPNKEFYKLLTDIEARAGHVAGAGYTVGELTWNHKKDKPDDEIHNILLRMGIDLKDWRLANEQMQLMKHMGFKPDPALVAKVDELEKTWDHDGFAKWAFENGPKPQCVIDMENEVYGRLKAQTCAMPYSPEPLAKRFARLRKTGYIPEHLLTLPDQQ